MRLPLSWLSEFVSIEADTDELCRRLTLAGLEVEEVESLKPAFSGVLTARVTSVERHPRADRLSLCRVDAGAAGGFSVVCGAPNVKPGMAAALARVGARLGDAPPLQAVTIRGVRSEGMLCSERELGFSDEHTGILALEDDTEPGLDLAAVLGLDDTVIDVAITPNRGDCLSVLGLAREIAALFDARLKPPKIGRAAARRGRGTEGFSVEIAAPDLCPRYAAQAMVGVTVGPSPLWLRRRLELAGMRALNNVVDATNYVMLELGQPLHAFDMDTIAEAKIIVRRAGEDREFVTLDEIKRKLEPSDLLICDPRKPLAIAGVMGGRESEVSESTRAILLESACFDPIAVARTSRRLGLQSEASYRFERGIDRSGQTRALKRVAEIIARIGGAPRAGAIVDVVARAMETREIELGLRRMAMLLGVEIPLPAVRSRLKRLGAQVRPGRKGTLKVAPPPFRPDLNHSADLAEEVARLGGAEEIPATLPRRLFVTSAADRESAVLRDTREVMLGCGMTEFNTIAFIAPAHNERFPAFAGGERLKVENPLSAELSEMRLSLLPGLLAALRFNLNRQASAVHAFEIGKVFSLREGEPTERQHLGVVSYGPYARPAVGQAGGETAGLFSVKGIIETYFESAVVADRVSFEPIPPERSTFLHPGRAAAICLDGEEAGCLGELHPIEARRLALTGPCAVCELDLGKILAYGFMPRESIEAPARFPLVRRDVALIIDRDFPAGRVARAFKEAGSSLLEDVEIFDVFEGASLPAGKKSVALALRYRSRDRTLKDEEVNRVHGLLVERARRELGAELRG